MITTTYCYRHRGPSAVSNKDGDMCCVRSDDVKTFKVLYECIKVAAVVDVSGTCCWVAFMRVAEAARRRCSTSIEVAECAVPNGQLEPRTGSAHRPACCATERPPRQGRRVRHSGSSTQARVSFQNRTLSIVDPSGFALMGLPRVTVLAPCCLCYQVSLSDGPAPTKRNVVRFRTAVDRKAGSSSTSTRTVLVSVLWSVPYPI